MTTTILSRQQARALWLTADGYTNRQVAEVMGLNEKTIKGYLEIARDKLGAKNTVHAVVIAMRRGII